MQTVARYIFTVICAAALCGFVQMFFHKSGYLSSLIKFVTGLVLSIAVLGPVVNMEKLNLDDIFDLLPEYEQTSVSEGKQQAITAMGDIIKEQTQTYILEQADMLGVRVQVEVTVSSDDPPVPSTVVITGDVSPYIKKQLQNMIKTDLGIAEEDQVWI